MHSSYLELSLKTEILLFNSLSYSQSLQNPRYSVISATFSYLNHQVYLNKQIKAALDLVDRSQFQVNTKATGRCNKDLLKGPETLGSVYQIHGRERLR